MNPNPFRFRLLTLDEVSMPVGNGQIVGLQRFRFDGNVVNGLLRTVFSKMKKRSSEKANLFFRRPFDCGIFNPTYAYSTKLSINSFMSLRVSSIPGSPISAKS